MPGVETGRLATLAAPEKDFAGTADHFHGQPASGDDFDRVMRATLAPPSHKPSAKQFSRMEHNPVPAGKFSQTSRQANSANQKNSTACIPGDKPDETNGGKKTDTTGADGKVAADINGQAVSSDTPEPLPIFLSLPLLFGLADEVPQLEKTGALEKDQSAGDQATGKFLCEVLPLASMPQTLIGNSGGSANGTEKSLPLEDLSPKTELANLFSPANSPEKKTDFVSVVALEHAAEGAGTGVATTDLPMKNPQKTNKNAGPDVKVLPVDGSGAAREKNLPTHWLATAVSAANNGGADLNFSFSSGNGHTAMTQNAPVLDIVDLPSLADARMRAMERAHDMMALHAMRLVESKSDTLSVVIKPAVGTELSLELRQRNGGVEAQATLTRGDREFLSQHWPELQQRLEQRGIKLAPLAGETNFSPGDNGNFQRQQTSQEDAAQQASAFAEFASVTAAGGATARLAAVHDGWESWA